MRPSSIVLGALVAAPALAPMAADAGPQCVGFLNQTEQGYKIEGRTLEPSGPKVAAGTELEFNAFIKIEGRMFLTRARSDVVFDSEHVELPSSCDLPTRQAPGSG